MRAGRLPVSGHFTAKKRISSVSLTQWEARFIGDAAVQLQPVDAPTRIGSCREWHVSCAGMWAKPLIKQDG